MACGLPSTNNEMEYIMIELVRSREGSGARGGRRRKGGGAELATTV